jgi:uncharacterized protein (TIGR02145 family)
MYNLNTNNMKMIKKVLMTVMSGFFFSICAAQDLTVCNSSSYTIPSIQSAGSSASYQWTENGVDIPGATDESYTNMTGKTEAGVYVYVRMAYTDDCERQASNGVIVRVVVSLDEPVITKPANGCEGESLMFTVPNIPGVTYEWSGGGTASGNSYTFQMVTAGTKTVTVRAVGNIGEPTCISPYSSASVVVYKQPVITTPPVASQAICPETAVSLSVSATDATSYQWLKNGVETTEGSGYTSSNYTTSTLTASGTYQVVVKNNGLCPVTSNEMVVTIRTGPDCCHLPGASGILFSEFKPCVSAPDLSTWTLTDGRDGKTYKVKKLADGRYWMVQDLKFGTCTDDSFHNDNSLGDTELAPTVAAGYVGHCRTSTASSAVYLYNWAAAMNNRNGYYGSTDDSFQCTGTGSSANQCRGICPEGWHVPTKDEFSSAHSAFASAYSCSNEDCWKPSSNWEGVLGGHCSSISAMTYANSRGYYWSSSWHNRYDAYTLRFYTNNLSAGTMNENKYHGLAVRCVRNY